MQEFYKLELLRESADKSKSVDEYLIGQALGSGEIAERAAEASAAFGVSVLPFAGVAACLTQPEEGADIHAFAGDSNLFFLIMNSSRKAYT